MSRRHKCVDVIYQMGKSSFGLFVSALILPRVLGSIPGWVTKNCEFIWNIAGKVSGESDVESITIVKMLSPYSPGESDY